jgi:hypothetical protein
MLTSLADLPALIQVVGIVLVLLLLIFIVRFLIPALSLHRRLKRVLKSLNSDALRGPVDLAPAFRNSGVLEHLWREYFETLHPEKALDANTGRLTITRYRATQPASAHFTEEAVVDSVVGSEFFKHLPGLFTGFGIIGTFLGLMNGLAGFDPSVDESAVRDSLKALIASVSEAFLVSAGAIVLAMITTVIEKGLLVRLYKRAEALTHAIDEHFQSGVGEEYLARLVSASEESASQTRILKDALVEDLRGLLTELVDRQIQAQSTSHSQLGDRIAQVFNAELGGPIDKIASAVQKVGQSQGEAVQSLLTDVLTAFSTKMESMFGNQLAGIHDLQQQTVSALQGAVAHLEGMAKTIEGAGTRAADSMAQQMTDAMRKLESRQTVMNEEMRKFVGDIRDLVRNSQIETGSHLSSLLKELSEKTSGVVSQLSDHAKIHAEGMGEQLRHFTETVGHASSQLARAVDRLEQITTDAIGRMNAGADTLANAAGQFAQAGAGVRDVIGRAETLGRHLAESAGSVATAVRSLDAVINDYKAHQATAKEMLDVAQKTVESAKREAALTEEVVRSLGDASKRLTEAQRSAEEYLESVSSVLAEAHSAFAENVSQTLNRANQEFYETLSRATKLLKEAIGEFEATLSSSSS